MNKVNQDFFMETTKHWGRVRSCGIIIENDSILMVTNDKVDYYYSVGGAICLGESVEEGCIREVFEETGIHYKIDRLVFIHENFFINENQKQCHEIAFYFLMKPEGIFEFDCKSCGMYGNKESLVWISINDYHNYTAYPRFFKDELKQLPMTVKHIITKENK